MWDVKEPKHYSKSVGREVPGVVAVLCVVNTGPMLIAVTITEMVILYKYVKIYIYIYIVISNSPSQDYTHPDDRTLLYDIYIYIYN